MDEQIKPAAWVHRQDAMFTDAGNWRYTNPILAATQESPELVPLYSQQSIDALRAEVERLRASNELYSFAMNTGGIDFLRMRAERAEAEAEALTRACEGLLAFIREKYPHDFVEGGRGYICPHHIAIAAAIDAARKGAE